MYRTAEGQFEAKRYQVVIQVPSKPEKPSTDKLLILGEATLDLAQFAPNIADVPQKFHMAVPTKLKRTAHVHGTVTVTIVQAKMALDGMTNMSRYSGNTGPMSTVLEQARPHILCVDMTVCICTCACLLCSTVLCTCSPFSGRWEHSMAFCLAGFPSL